jgi:hypothetical protein
MNRKGYDEQTWFTLSHSPVRDESGRVAGMFCAVSETTEKVLAERALRQSEAVLELNETLERRVTEAIAESNVLADIVEGTNAFVHLADFLSLRSSSRPATSKPPPGWRTANAICSSSPTAPRGWRKRWASK